MEIRDLEREREREREKKKMEEKRTKEENERRRKRRRREGKERMNCFLKRQRESHHMGFCCFYCPSTEINTKPE